ncbi:MAG: FtsX-like permease family protein [Gemmatimonadaceae bacterium]
MVVLLVACANIINLLLARLMRRRREIAVRVALGAGRGRLVRLLLTEGMLLAVGGGVAGLAVAYWLGYILRRSLLTSVEWTTSPVDSRVLAVTTLIALATGVIVGLAPAIRASRPDITSALKADARTGGGARSRGRTALMLLQASLSVVLLIGAGLFVQSVRRVYALDLGIQADRVITVPINVRLIAAEPPDLWKQRRARFNEMALERARQLPGVEHASLANGLPFRGVSGVGIYIPGRDSLPALRGGLARIQGVSSDYFTTVGTRILRGRAFTPSDETGGEHVSIVSERLARTYWPNEDAIGKCFAVLSPKNPCARIVGIAANTYTRDITEEPGLQFYVPITQMPFGGITSLVVRPKGDPVAMIGTLRRAMLDVDPTLAYLDFKTLDEAMDPQIRPWRLGATAFTLMGALAALVAAVGLYSVLSYMVTQRTHEIGVRMALGASGANVLGTILRHSVVVGAVGTLLGIVFALLAGPYVEPLLFRTSARDPAVFGVVTMTLLTVAILAGLLPAVRAQRIDPVEALRAE